MIEWKKENTMKDEALESLKALPLFSSLSQEALETLAGRTVVRTLPEKALLFREGEPAKGLYLILWGAIEIYRSSEDGREQVIHVERRGRQLGELPLLDGSPYPASARAGTETRVVFLPREAFQWAYRENPEIADTVIRDLGGRLRKMVSLVEKLSLKDVTSRVAAAVLEAAITADKARNGATFHLPRTQDQMAGQLATTRESVSRAMARLGQEGALSHRKSKITIRDIGVLERMAGGTVEDLTGSVFDQILPTVVASPTGAVPQPER
jgi:CRP/FNR family transcriptional regulator, dissimilatory nitrate respiration regulator